MTTTVPALPGGTWRLGDVEVPRFGYGAMRLAGPGVMGPPADRAAAIAVLREAVALGVRHLDTSGAYGPRVVNGLIREALAPYPDGLVVATKVGGARDAHGGWPVARRPEQLEEQVRDDLETLGVDALDVVHLRMGDGTGPRPGSVAEPLQVLTDLRDRGLIRHLGLSNATPEQVAEARGITPLVAIQNRYNLADRADDALIDDLAAAGVAYTAYFPLGGFSPLQSTALQRVAERRGSTATSVALAWLLQRSPNVLLIPGTSSAAHLRQNAAGAALELDAADLEDLAEIGD